MKLTNRRLYFIALAASLMIYIFIGMPGLVTKTVLYGEETIGISQGITIDKLAGLMALVIILIFVGNRVFKN